MRMAGCLYGVITEPRSLWFDPTNTTASMLMLGRVEIHSVAAPASPSPAEASEVVALRVTTAMLHLPAPTATTEPAAPVVGKGGACARWPGYLPPSPPRCQATTAPGAGPTPCGIAEGGRVDECRCDKDSIIVTSLWIPPPIELVAVHTSMLLLFTGLVMPTLFRRRRRPPAST